jgi:hypothetical protein
MPATQVLLLALPAAFVRTAAAAEDPSTTALSHCNYAGVERWEAEPKHVFVMPCSELAATQRWSGGALSKPATASVLENDGAPLEQRCLGIIERDPIGMVGCTAAPHFVYNHSNQSIAIADGTGRCVDVNHGAGPDVDFYACHGPGGPDVSHQQFHYSKASRQLISAVNSSLCLAVNRSIVVPYIEPPCVWPSVPASGLPFAPSTQLVGIAVIENATAIKNYGRSCQGYILSYSDLKLNSLNSRPAFRGRHVVSRRRFKWRPVLGV